MWVERLNIKKIVILDLSVDLMQCSYKSYRALLLKFLHNLKLVQIKRNKAVFILKRNSAQKGKAYPDYLQGILEDNGKQCVLELATSLSEGHVGKRIRVKLRIQK